MQKNRCAYKNLQRLEPVNGNRLKKINVTCAVFSGNRVYAYIDNELCGSDADTWNPFKKVRVYGILSLAAASDCVVALKSEIQEENVVVYDNNLECLRTYTIDYAVDLFVLHKYAVYASTNDNKAYRNEKLIYQGKHENGFFGRLTVACNASETKICCACMDGTMRILNSEYDIIRKYCLKTKKNPGFVKVGLFNGKFVASATHGAAFIFDAKITPLAFTLGWTTHIASHKRNVICSSDFEVCVFKSNGTPLRRIKCEAPVLCANENRIFCEDGYYSY